jgi:hypothetical protein
VHTVTYDPISGTAHYRCESFRKKLEETRFDFVIADPNVTIMSLVELPDGAAPAPERSKFEQATTSSNHSLTGYRRRRHTWQ